MRLVRLFFYIFTVLLLAACGSTPTEEVSQETTTKKVIETSTVAPSVQDSSYFLQQAKSAPTRQQGKWLLKVAQVEQSQSCNKAIAIAQRVLQEVDDIEDKTLGYLIQAECYIQQGNYPQAQAIQNNLLFQMGFDSRIHLINGALFEHQQAWLQAAKSYVLAEIPDDEKAYKIWQLLNQLPVSSLVTSTEYQRLIPWIELNKLVRLSSAHPQKLKDEYTKWVSKYAGLAVPPTLNIIDGINTPQITPQHIAIILPLTGRNQAQGQAVKNGILAAYINYTKQKPKLSFFDANLDTFNETFFVEQGIDAVIGPLLKENIPLIQAQLPDDIPFLALNRPDTNTSSITDKENDTEDDHFFFSLAPEDEAIQLAHILFSQGYQTPVVVSTSNQISQRMQNAFHQTWTELTQSVPVSVEVSDNKNMRDGLAEVLSFAQSDGRIKQIENMLPQKLYSEKRSRRDLDVAVLLANSAQTELLNPIIETNTSPFADILPVFASSRSYRTNMSNNALRDFRNVTFTDMPWMLPKNPWQQLSQRVNTLWPNETDTNLRLFAMGYDAFNLLPIIRHMRIFDAYHFSGLTGELSVTTDGQIVRMLPMGKIDGKQVVNLGMVQ